MRILSSIVPVSYDALFIAFLIMKLNERGVMAVLVFGIFFFFFYDYPLYQMYY